MPEVTVAKARELLEVVIGPEELVAKVPEFGFANLQAVLQANGLTKIPPLPTEEKLLLAKEQKKPYRSTLAK